MKIQVEFLGLSRLLTREKEISLELAEGATFSDIVQRLGTMYPALIGEVIRPGESALQEPNIFNVNARKMIRPGQMASSPNDGDQVILMSMSAGG